MLDLMFPVDCLLLNTKKSVARKLPRRRPTTIATSRRPVSLRTSLPGTHNVEPTPTKSGPSLLHVDTEWQRPSTITMMSAMMPRSMTEASSSSKFLTISS